MFSYRAGVWQTLAAKRGDKRFNGIARTLSGMLALKTRFTLDTNYSDSFFALDSATPCATQWNHFAAGSAAGSAKLMFAGSLAAVGKSSDPVDLHKNLSPRRPAVRGQCALQTRSSLSRRANRRF